jgi:RNA polymerase sigma-70 factor (ECF subfamily)
MTCPDDGLSIVWIRWQTTDRSVVRNTAAFLATTTTRLAINVMQSARSRRETYVGCWLSEPVDTGTDPGLGAERGETLQLGVLVLLETLSPTERAAYILREAFDYAYRDIANLLRLEEANARQVVTRARQHVANGRRMPANATEQRRRVRSVARRNGPLRRFETTVNPGWRNGDEAHSSVGAQYQSLMDFACRVAHSLPATRVKGGSPGLTGYEHPRKPLEV